MRTYILAVLLVVAVAASAAPTRDELADEVEREYLKREIINRIKARIAKKSAESVKDVEQPIEEMHDEGSPDSIVSKSVLVHIEAVLKGAVATIQDQQKEIAQLNTNQQMMQGQIVKIAEVMKKHGFIEVPLEEKTPATGAADIAADVTAADEQVKVNKSNLDRLLKVVASITDGENKHQEEIKRLNENQQKMIKEIKRMEEALMAAGIGPAPPAP